MWQVKTDALVGRGSTFHILETCKFAIFSRNPPQISKTYKSDNQTLKDLLLSMFMQSFNSLASTQTNKDEFWNFFQENFRTFQKIFK
jgi:hypothetical protein